MAAANARETILDHFRALANQGTVDLAGADAVDILRWTDEHLAGSYVIASSMENAALIHLAARVRPGVDVIFVDTGYHFAETIRTRDAVAASYDVNVITVQPEHDVAEQDSLLGANLFARNPDECCRLRRVEPLARVLRGYCGWVTGARRSESHTDVPVITFDETFGMVKVNPLAVWTDQDVERYLRRHGIVVNPLVREGYPSIGCAPCTSPPMPGRAKHAS